MGRNSNKENNNTEKNQKTTSLQRSEKQSENITGHTLQDIQKERKNAEND